MNFKISQVLYFGQPGTNRMPKKDSLKPPSDYENQGELMGLLKNFEIDCQIKYVNVSYPKNKNLIEKYDIIDSHTWVLEFKDEEPEIFNDDQPFLKRISELSK